MRDMGPTQIISPLGSSTQGLGSMDVNERKEDQSKSSTHIKVMGVIFANKFMLMSYNIYIYMYIYLFTRFRSSSLHGPSIISEG